MNFPAGFMWSLWGEVYQSDGFVFVAFKQRNRSWNRSDDVWTLPSVKLCYRFTLIHLEQCSACSCHRASRELCPLTSPMQGFRLFASFWKQWSDIHTQLCTFSIWISWVCRLIPETQKIKMMKLNEPVTVLSVDNEVNQHITRWHRSVQCRPVLSIIYRIISFLKVIQ